VRGGGVSVSQVWNSISFPACANYLLPSILRAPPQYTLNIYIWPLGSMQCS